MNCNLRIVEVIDSLPTNAWSCDVWNITWERGCCVPCLAVCSGSCCPSLPSGFHDGFPGLKGRPLARCWMAWVEDAARFLFLWQHWTLSLCDSTLLRVNYSLLFVTPTQLLYHLRSWRQLKIIQVDWKLSLFLFKYISPS